MYLSTNELYDQLNISSLHKRSIAIPNEYFELLLSLSKKKLLKPTHIGLAWSSLYLISFLYRYTLYNERYLSTNDLKVLLGYSAKDSRIDYLFKRNGLLDTLGLTESVSDIPLATTWDDITHTIAFTYLSEMDNEYQSNYKKIKGMNNRSFIKKPLFAFSRNGIEGTYYDWENTVVTEYKVFEFCMRNSELGCEAFYLYCYLLNEDFKYDQEYKSTYAKLSESTGLSSRTIQRYMDTLRKYNLIQVRFNVPYYNPNLKDRQASTIQVNSYERFSKTPVEYSKLKYNTSLPIETVVTSTEYDLFSG